MKAVKLIIGAFLTLIATGSFISFMVEFIHEPSRPVTPSDPSVESQLTAIRWAIVWHGVVMSVCIGTAMALYRSVLQPTIDAQKKAKAELAARKKAEAAAAAAAIVPTQSPTA